MREPAVGNPSGFEPIGGLAGRKMADGEGRHVPRIVLEQEQHRVAREFPKDHLLDRAGFGKHNRELQDRATRYSSPSSELRASRRALFLSKCFERVTDKIMSISERNVRVPLRAVMVVGRVAHL